MCLCVFKTIFSLLRHTLWLAVREIENDGDANVRWHTKCTFFIRFNCLCGTSHILLSDLHVGRLSRLPQLHWRSWNLCTSLATGSLVGIFLLLVSIFSSGSEKKNMRKNKSNLFQNSHSVRDQAASVVTFVEWNRMPSRFQWVTNDIKIVQLIRLFSNFCASFSPRVNSSSNRWQSAVQAPFKCPLTTTKYTKW